ncbi:hypothetical protein GCM10010156_02870 [Planobispora rosea]|uniref:Helix-hairpin-helix DNA-binding motif class 1 domain-containing protein n=1 Tax=Planobispora rosea TaxID=35762 RepID=A0A8J3RVN3_PLARO|nr:ComEA family DNA-binding protein [Planobispora rosea]GGS47533.1 hypothetical protein GCM10010156_02870 [Planobispora rosea]GIH82200.1 hypothetical protein Pro02_06080 [Planobispora rosea]
MRTTAQATDQATDRIRAESRLRALTAPVASHARSDGQSGSPVPDPGGLTARAAALAGRPPSLPVPPSFEALRTAVAAGAPELDPGRPRLRVLLLIALAAVVVGCFYAWWSRPEPEPLAPPPPVSGPSPETDSASSRLRPRPSEVTEVTVHVTGKVRHPGVLTLPGGSRVADAVQAAGGIRKGTAPGPLNLARRLVDGEQIVVGAPARGAPVTPVDPAVPAEAVLDLNTATAEQLDRLPGVGEVLARRITEYRDGHGGFRSVEQLREVTGIGDRKYAEIKDKVRV